jgi:hypothetical protein
MDSQINNQTQALLINRAETSRHPFWWTALAILLISILTGCSETEPDKEIIRAGPGSRNR